jgi:capsular polysaccharide biosynthesis protein
VDESKRIVHYTPEKRLGARLLINPCRTAGIHPWLWHNARRMYWSIAGLANRPEKPTARRNFIYIQRTSSNAMNGARLILNEPGFVALLRQFCSARSLNYVEYDHSKDTRHIRFRIELFYDAQYIIGVHSGALSNMNFARAGTSVIEIMPYRPESSSLPMTCSMFQPENLKACAGYILYTQSQLLNQTYWIVPVLVNAHGNLNLDLERMRTLLDRV